jgi:hypothetical protein
VICELLIFYEATKGLLVGMGDPPGIIYLDGYGSGEIPPPTTRYGDTHGVILLSWGWVWRVHTRWEFTHCHLGVKPYIYSPSRDRQGEATSGAQEGETDPESGRKRHPPRVPGLTSQE